MQDPQAEIKSAKAGIEKPHFREIQLEKIKI
ncbi:hypothetical protein HNQ06_001015 [Borrelia lanei]|uniref:Uncharacterized protein n=1 Tax=Borreliella lanei TaxID=373540 RepID=A0A7X0DK12_9SPIR|nr:hypothetical protein [Borreliella lanei]